MNIYINTYLYIHLYNIEVCFRYFRYRNWDKSHIRFLCTFLFPKAFSAIKDSGTILWDGCKFGSSSMFSGVCYPERALSFLEAAGGSSGLFDAWIILKEAGFKQALSFCSKQAIYIYTIFIFLHIICKYVVLWWHDTINYVYIYI